MGIAEKLDLLSLINSPQDCIVFTGSGGKTTALFHLARRALIHGFPAVIVSTTTHLSVEEVKQADQIIYIVHPEDWLRLEKASISGIVAVCGAVDGDGKVQGLSSSDIWRLRQISLNRSMLLLIEGDGSRRRPIKAPAEYEPEIPGFASHVVVVAGLTGLGKPLTSANVHRHEIFSRLSGLEEGQPVTGISLARMLTHPLGGLKNIPASARRTLLLNQMDAVDPAVSLQSIVDQTLTVFTQVIIASLASVEHPVHAIYRPVAGVILAAGSASRFGLPKQNLLWRGQTLLHTVLQNAVTAGLSPVRIVLGAHLETILPSLQESDIFGAHNIQLVINHDWRAGQSSSIRSGLDGLPEEVDSAIFLLADQPLVTPALILAIRKIRAETQAWVVAPRVQGQRINPVLFSRELFPRLHGLQGDIGGRKLFQEPISYPLAWLDWNDPHVSLEIDTPADYQRLLEMENP